MNEDEQRFWDAAFIGYVSGVAADHTIIKLERDDIAVCAVKADMMLEERRKRTAKSSAAA